MNMKIKRLMAFVLCLSLCPNMYGCNVIDEQWEVVEQYRLENTTTEDPALTTELTEAPLPEQHVLADFIDESQDTLRGRIIVPNGYTRINLTSEEEDLEWAARQLRATMGGVASHEDASKDAMADDISDASSDAGQDLGVDTGVSNGMEEVAGDLADNPNGSEEVAGDLADNPNGSEEIAGDLADNPSVTEEIAGETTTEQVTTEAPDNTTGKVYAIEEFMRALPVKPSGSKALLYSGQEKEQQDSYVALFNMALDTRNLQQRGSSMMRLYAEYYWRNQNYDCMQYHLNNGFLLDYKTWIDGYRLNVVNNAASWYNYGSAGDNYPTLLAYLENYFCYSGLSSMIEESHEAVGEVSVGDYFIDDNKEYAAMVVDVAENEMGDRCFLLATGGSPGQDIEILKNPAHEDPWYYVSECNGVFSTPEFDLNGALRYHLTTVESVASGDASGDASADAATSGAGEDVLGE